MALALYVFTVRKVNPEYAEHLNTLMKTERHVVVVEPEIHWNTGNIGRTCLATGATLHLIEPLGFSLDIRSLNLSTAVGIALYESLRPSAALHAWQSGAVGRGY
jgi:tRNA C32,U32 (ribose-2'-O)-methylase TrmJ